MADKGHEETEKLLKKMEKQLDEVYKEAYTEARDTATSFMAKFRVMDEEKRRLRDSGELDNSEYQRWRRTMLFQGKRYKEMADTLAADMTKTNVIAASVINGHLPEVYAINHNYGTYEIEHGGKINTQYSLYDRQTVERLIRDNPDLLPRKAAINIPKDELWNKNHINSAVMQGILQGKTVDDIAKNVAATVTDMSHTSAIRNARTMTTSAQNGGRIDSYKRAQNMGVKLVQVWMATLDGRTRHEHRQLDGQKQPIGTPFKIDGMEIEFPGDPKAEPYLVYNCRCTLIGEVEGVDYNLSDVTERDSKLGDMTYEEWKEEKKKQKESEPKSTGTAPQGKAVEINVPSAKIYKNSLDNAGDTSIIKSGHKMAASNQEPPDFSKYEVKEDIEAVNSIKNTISKKLGIDVKDIDLTGIKNIEALEPFVDRLAVIKDRTGMAFPPLKALEVIEGDQCCVADYKPMENRLFISSKYFNSKKALEDSMIKWANNGAMPSEAKTIEYLAEHEAAHIRIPDKELNTKEAMNILRKFNKTKYANDNDEFNIYEFFSDSVAWHNISPTTTPSKMLEAVEYLRKRGIK